MAFLVGGLAAELPGFDLVDLMAVVFELLGGKSALNAQVDKLTEWWYKAGMGNIQYQADGTYSRNVPIRLPQVVYEAYQKKARAENMSVGIWIKRLLMQLSGVEISNGSWSNTG